jgi:hypothetical protein
MDVPWGDARTHGRSLLHARPSSAGAPTHRSVVRAASRLARKPVIARTHQARRLLGARAPGITTQVAGAAARRPVPVPHGRGQTDLLRRRDVEDRWRPERPSAGIRRAIGVAGTAVVAICLGVVAYRLVPGPSPRHAPAPGAVAATAPPILQAEAWIKANLPHHTPLSADAAVADTLAGDGFTADKFPAGGRWDADRFIVSTPAIQGDIARQLAASAERISSVRVAVFGPATQLVEVRMIVPGSASSLEQRMARDARDRLEAGHALLANRRLTTDPQPRAVLRSGELDMRAAAVLALLATKADVHVTRFALDKSEAAAGSPARTMTLSLRDAKALTDTLRMLPRAYAPSEVATPSDRSHELTWSVGLAPPVLLS